MKIEKVLSITSFVQKVKISDFENKIQDLKSP
jgi:hypothetical protein